METIELSSWTEFETRLNEIRSKYGTRESKSYDITQPTTKNDILYRGQSDSALTLQTTLERFSQQEWTLKSYLALLLRCVHQIETFTGNKWNLDRDKIFEELEREFDELFKIPTPSYEFWTYLRHLGFPSPLLDWTYSPYIALFFAFAKQDSAKRAIGKASVYAYIETPSGVKSDSSHKPKMAVKGPYVTTHKRHYFQQSLYTIAAEAIVGKNDYKFVCHEDVFKAYGERKKDQDVCIKINIPRNKRIEVLEYLDAFNINHFSLIQSEESLIRSLAFKEIERKTIE